MAYRVVDDKWIFNDDSKLYLRNFADALKEDTLVNKEDGDFWWVKSGDAYVNVVNSSLTVHVDGGDEEDVPVNRAAALIEEALNAAAQIGDDTLQRRARGTVVPESFTHGSSAQRVRWFKRGLAAGDLKACDTFGAASL